MNPQVVLTRLQDTARITRKSKTSPEVKTGQNMLVASDDVTETESEVQGEAAAATAAKINHNKSAPQKTRENAEDSSESESTLVENESERTVVAYEEMQKSIELNLEPERNKNAKETAVDADDSEKNSSNGRDKVQESEGVSGKSPKSTKTQETAETQENASWEDLEEDEEANEPPIKTKELSIILNKCDKKALAKKNQLRAISTPNKNESHLQSNVTFMDRSEAADISAIPILSPPTSRKTKKTVNEASFQFRTKRGRSDDMFDNLIDQEPKRAKSSHKTTETASSSSTRAGRTPRKNPKYK